jgi:hypothetical protein
MGTYVQLWSGYGTLQTLCALSYVRQSAAPIRIFAKLLDFRTAGKLKKCQDAPRAWPRRSRSRRYVAAVASSTAASATRTIYARAGRHGIQCVTIEKAALRAATPITAASIITAVSREPMVSERPIDARATDAERLGDVGRPHALCLQFANPCLVYRSWASLVGAGSLRLADALKLALAAEVCLELGEYAEHIEKALAGGGARVDWLLGRPECGALGTHRADDVLARLSTLRRPLEQPARPVRPAFAGRELRTGRLSFAFQLAREATGKIKASYRAGEGSRDGLMLDPLFAQGFHSSKERIRGMEYRYVEEADQNCPSLARNLLRRRGGLDPNFSGRVGGVSASSSIASQRSQPGNWPRR